MTDVAFIGQATAAYAAAQSKKGLQAARGAANLAAKKQDVERMRQVARDFEAVFLGQMLQPMFSEMGKDDPFSGPGQDIWRSMQANEYGKAMTKAGGIGLADQVLKEMIKMQEAR